MWGEFETTTSLSASAIKIPDNLPAPRKKPGPEQIISGGEFTSKIDSVSCPFFRKKLKLSKNEIKMEENAKMDLKGFQLDDKSIDSARDCHKNKN